VMFMIGGLTACVQIVGKSSCIIAIGV